MGKQPNEIIITSEKPTNTMINDISKNLGIDVGDIIKDVAKDYAKETVFGKKNNTPAGRTKFSKALDGISNFVRSVWWVPAAMWFMLGIAIIGIKFLEKLAGV